ncbi:hypothetical protein DPEC_G00182040 [Dallia pectoralis]|uniref:Uncharacterized protein n=1 Tax=Dallia pectoralis TaxID=75939 RepID=A0ACC2GA63_DALPE|nr:hypothetical protein DPEC_G00182040 [Dallia pectoralis]
MIVPPQPGTPQSFLIDTHFILMFLDDFRLIGFRAVPNISELICIRGGASGGSKYQKTRLTYTPTER